MYEYLLPIFTAETGIEVRVVAGGTGQAIRNASSGDADVLLVHSKFAEESFVVSGSGVKRFDLMYNDFVIIGPASDPLGLSDMTDLGAALRMLAQGDARFVSRGDDSGTHKMEQKLWEVVGQAPAPSAWYARRPQGWARLCAWRSKFWVML
ncbi:MAG TPA: hypothetical protein EYQ81_08270 [Sneathiellales bacterium]|nr:hypothetical protein [Sneathiellales bacterium]